MGLICFVFQEHNSWVKSWYRKVQIRLQNFGKERSQSIVQKLYTDFNLFVNKDLHWFGNNKTLEQNTGPIGLEASIKVCIFIYSNANRSYFYSLFIFTHRMLRLKINYWWYNRNELSEVNWCNKSKFSFFICCKMFFPYKSSLLYQRFKSVLSQQLVLEDSNQNGMLSRIHAHPHIWLRDQKFVASLKYNNL